MNDQIISQEGYNKLKEELDLLSTTRRKEIADRIETAKDLGDLSENAEYSEAKDSQSLNEGRILEITNLLKNVTVVEPGNNEGQAAMGSKITVTSEAGEKEYTIVSFNEADPLEGKISNESPLGVAFIGRNEGETVDVVTPRGVKVYKIKKIV